MGYAAGAVLAPLESPIIAGAISGATISGFSSAAMGGRDLGRNILMGAFQGALGAGLALGIQRGIQLSQASLAEQQGGEEDFATGKKDSRAWEHQPAKEGRNINYTAYRNRETDVFVAHTDGLRIDDVYPDKNGIPVESKISLRQAAARYSKEYGVLYYKEEGSAGVKYRIVQSTRSNESIQMNWNAGERPVAYTHVHWNQSDAELWFSNGDTLATRPCYALSTGNSAKAYIPVNDRGLGGGGWYQVP